MIKTKDIQQRIEADFGKNAADVVKIFDDAISSADHINNDRIIRCILFLADKDISKLKINVRAAAGDPRDVMLWAEYENGGQDKNVKRLRDFNKPFNLADVDVDE